MRAGTWQGDAIGSAVFATGALEPLLTLCAHADTTVVRHVARTLAELSYVCLTPTAAVSRPFSSCSRFHTD